MWFLSRFQLSVLQRHIFLRWFLANKFTKIREVNFYFDTV